MCFLCSENKGADQLRGYREAGLRLCFCICRSLVFSCEGFLVISDSNPLKGIGNLTIHASNEDDPYVTLKDDVRLCYFITWFCLVKSNLEDCQCVCMQSNEIKMIVNDNDRR